MLSLHCIKQVGLLDLFSSGKKPGEQRRGNCWGKFADETNSIAASFSKSCRLADEIDETSKNIRGIFVSFLMLLYSRSTTRLVANADDLRAGDAERIYFSRLPLNKSI